MNPLFEYTVGQAWNQDPSVFLCLLAAVLHVGALRRPRPAAWLAGSGFCLGLAIGTRLTHAPAVAVFAGVLLLFPAADDLRARWKHLAIFGTALFVALLPTFFLLLVEPRQFLFDNFEFQQLSEHFRRQTGFREAMTLRGKVGFLADLLHNQPATLLLFVSFAVLAVSTVLSAFRAGSDRAADQLFLIALVPALFIGSFAPTPSWQQYYYQPIPVMVVAIVCMLSSVPPGRDKKWATGLCATLAAVSIVFGFFEYRDTPRTPGRFTPVETHAVGLEIRREVGHGKVLTLAPLFPLEGGLDIYDDLATGFVLWRSAPFLHPDKRERFGVVSKDELCALIAAEPPRGVLLGFEPEEQEFPLVAYAVRNGYRAKILSNGMTLWVAPEPLGKRPLCGPDPA
jgi:hypothetical protein